MDQPRTPPAPTVWLDNDLQVRGLGRHGPDHASRGDLVVGPPRRSLGYAIGGPPRVRGRGAPNAAYPHSSVTC
jgi:hypothetical protein